MVSLNRVIVAGKLKDDPELKDTAEGRKFSTMRIVIEDSWKNKDGAIVKKSTFVNVVCWGSLAENVSRYLKRGRPVMVQGRIETDSYTDSKGCRQNITRINATNVVFLESNKSESKGARDYAY